MDWHSSGITTSVLGALKRSLNPRSQNSALPILRRALDAAKLGHTEKLEGFRRLDRLTRNVESDREPLADFAAALDHEREISPSLGGRTVFDDPPPIGEVRVRRQLSLFPE